jgi:hypothetical protein
MSLVGSYSVSGATVSVSYEYSSVDELLLGLLDNNSASIKAVNVRNSVYTLWQKVDTFSASVATASVGAVSYSALTASSIQSAIGGLTPGFTFSGTLQSLVDKMIYPYVAPVPSIGSIGSGVLEFGSSTIVVLNYSVSLGTESILPLSLLVDGTSKVFPPYSGVHSTSATHSAFPVTASESNVFYMSVSDGTSTVTSSQTLYWMNKRYWGSINLTSIGNPNLTTNPGSASIVASLCTDSVIKSLTGAGANGVAYGSEFSTTKSKSYYSIDGGGKYLIFAWPSTVSGATSPNFKVNGIINTAFTNVRTSSPFVNSQGYSGVDYEVWVSNTIYFSPVDIEIS